MLISRLFVLRVLLSIFLSPFPSTRRQVGGCGGFGKGNFSELFKSIEDYERVLDGTAKLTAGNVIERNEDAGGM